MYGAALERETPLASWNPFRRLPRPPADAYTRTEALADPDARLILASAKGTRDRVILRLLYDTGMRRSSVASLERDAVIFRGEKTVLRIVVKGNRRFEAELPSVTAELLLRWLKESSSTRWVFPARNSAQHIHASAINKIVTACARKGGVGSAHPHQFRASYVTTALDAGVPLHEVQASVHHADPKMTLRYDRGQRGTGVSSAVAKFRGTALL